jgi:hypothetical protein
MAILWTHLITWIVMAVMILLALLTNSNNKIYEMITRLGYIVIIITGILMFGHAWQKEPTLLIVKIILAIIFIAIVEIAFARKNAGMLSPQIVWTVVVFCIVVALVGFALSGWYPFVQH